MLSSTSLFWVKNYTKIFVRILTFFDIFCLLIDFIEAELKRRTSRIINRKAFCSTINHNYCFRLKTKRLQLKCCGFTYASFFKKPFNPIKLFWLPITHQHLFCIWIAEQKSPQQLKIFDSIIALLN